MSKIALKSNDLGTGTINLIAPNTDATIDINLDQLVTDAAQLGIEQEWLAQQTPFDGTLTAGATIDWNGDSNGQVVSVTLDQDSTFNAPTNINVNALYVLVLTTAGFTPGWNVAYKWNTVPVLDDATYTMSFVGGVTNTLLPMGTPYKVGA